MKIRFTPRAVSDLAAMAEFLHEHSPAAAVHVRAAVLTSIKTLLLFPRVGRPQNIAGVRKLVTRRYGYLVYYTIDDGADEISILTIQHSAREAEFGNAQPAALVEALSENTHGRSGEASPIRRPWM